MHWVTEVSLAATKASRLKYPIETDSMPSSGLLKFWKKQNRSPNSDLREGRESNLSRLERFVLQACQQMRDTSNLSGNYFFLPEIQN